MHIYLYVCVCVCVNLVIDVSQFRQLDCQSVRQAARQVTTKKKSNFCCNCNSIRKEAIITLREISSMLRDLQKLEGNYCNKMFIYKQVILEFLAFI